MEFRGSFEVDARRSSVYAEMVKPEVLSRSIPDAEDVSVSDEEIHCRIRLKIAVVQSSMNVVMRVVEKKEGSEVRIAAMASGSGSNAKIDTVFSLSGEDTTTVSWHARAELTGLIGGLGSTLLKSYAEREVAKVTENMKKLIVQQTHP